MVTKLSQNAQNSLKIIFFVLLVLGVQPQEAKGVTGVFWDSSSLYFQYYDDCSNSPVNDDTNGYFINQAPYGICNVVNASKPYTVIPTKDEGYNWWVFSSNSLGASSGLYANFVFRDIFSNSTLQQYSVSATTTYTLNVPFSDASGLYRSRFDGVSDMPTGDYKLTSLSIGGFNSIQYYGVIYTNADLSYIDQQAELYAMLDGYYPSTNPYDFTNPTGDTAIKYIEIIEPTYGTTTASTTIDIAIHFKTPFSFDFRPTTTREYRIMDAVTGIVEQVYQKTLEANAGEDVLYTATTTLTEGSKIIEAGYFDQNGIAYGSTDEVFFNVATNTYFLATGLSNPKQNGGTLTQIDCSTFDLGCQFQKAMTFLFYPSDGILDKFSTLWQNIKYKKPIGYITVTIEQLKSLDATGAHNFDFGTIPFMDIFFTPFKIALGTILWAIYAIYFYHNRLKRIDI